MGTGSAEDPRAPRTIGNTPPPVSGVTGSGAGMQGVLTRGRRGGGKRGYLAFWSWSSPPLTPVRRQGPQQVLRGAEMPGERDEWHGQGAPEKRKDWKTKRNEKADAITEIPKSSIMPMFAFFFFSSHLGLNYAFRR